MCSYFANHCFQQLNEELVDQIAALYSVYYRDRNKNKRVLLKQFMKESSLIFITYRGHRRAHFSESGSENQ